LLSNSLLYKFRRRYYVYDDDDDDDKEQAFDYHIFNIINITTRSSYKY